MYYTTFSNRDLTQGGLGNDKCNLKMFGVILQRNVEALSLKTILTVGRDCSGLHDSSRWWGGTTFGRAGLRAHDGECETLHGAITVKLRMA